jgi:hypothetical protein
VQQWGNDTDRGGGGGGTEVGHTAAQKEPRVHGAQHPVAQHPVAQHPVAQHPVAQHPVAQHL